MKISSQKANELGLTVQQLVRYKEFLKEAEQLEVGQYIKLSVKWNEDGHGQTCDIVRPIEVLIIEEPKYKQIK